MLSLNNTPLGVHSAVCYLYNTPLKVHSAVCYLSITLPSECTVQYVISL